MLQQKWSNILQLCLVDEWLAIDSSKNKGKGLKKKAASTEPGSLALYVRSKQISKRMQFLPRRPANRGRLALIDDDLLGENFILPPGERYQPVDRPLARRGVFLPFWKCKYQFSCMFLCFSWFLSL